VVVICGWPLRGPFFQGWRSWKCGVLSARRRILKCWRVPLNMFFIYTHFNRKFAEMLLRPWRLTMDSADSRARLSMIFSNHQAVLPRVRREVHWRRPQSRRKLTISTEATLPQAHHQVYPTRGTVQG